MPKLLGDSIPTEEGAIEEQNSSSHARRSLLMAKMLDDRLEGTNSVTVDREAGSADLSASVSDMAANMETLSMTMDVNTSVDDNKAQLREMDSAISELERWRKTRQEVLNHPPLSLTVFSNRAWRLRVPKKALDKLYQEEKESYSAAQTSANARALASMTKEMGGGTGTGPETDTMPPPSVFADSANSSALSLLANPKQEGLAECGDESQRTRADERSIQSLYGLLDSGSP